jgi:hypothetical protein
MRVCVTQGCGFASTLGFILSPTTWAKNRVVGCFQHL